MGNLNNILEVGNNKNASTTFNTNEYSKSDCSFGSKYDLDVKRWCDMEKLPSEQIQLEVDHKDNVNHPSHYTWLKDKCGIEVIDITRHLDFDTGNAIKYLLRHGHKNEQGMSDKAKAIEDLKKAIWYIKDKIKMLND